jgi:predicted transcriptional regulator YheO
VKPAATASRPWDGTTLWCSLVADVERRLGHALRETPPDERARAVALLSDAGALELRNAVSLIARALGVSRYTVYGDLHALTGSSGPERS